MLLFLGYSLAAHAIGTTTTLTVSPASVAAGANVTLTASVNGLYPTGNVVFKDGATTIGTVALSGSGFTRTAVLTTAFSTVGAHSITAAYAGNGGGSLPSTSTAKTVTVTLKSTTNTLTVNPTTAAVGVNVALTATVVGYTPTGTVTFKDGATTIGTASLTGTGTTATATLNTPFSTVASHSITAVYAGDANDAASTSTAKVVTVTSAATSTTLVMTPQVSPSTNPPSIPIAETATLTATVTGSSPTGNVTFKDGSATLGTGTLTGTGNTRTATFSTYFTTTGAHNLTADYVGDASNTASTSSIGVTVNKASPVTDFAFTTPNPSTVGADVTLTIGVGGGFDPTGTVTIKSGSATLGTSVYANGSATFTTSFATVGTRSITVEYGGDVNNNPSTSIAKNLGVNAGASTTTLSAPNSADVNQNVTLTATVSGGNATGMVTFKEGATTLGTGTIESGIATLNTSFSTAGTHDLTATYGGDANYTASTSAAVAISVTTATTATALTVSPNPANVNQTVTLTATVTGSNPTGTVNFKNGANTVGTATLVNGVATLDTSFPAYGGIVLTAEYVGDANNAASTSPGVTLTLSRVNSLTTFTFNPDPAIIDLSVALTATVTGDNPTGAVTFTDGETALGTVTLTAGVATLNTTFSTGGVHSLSVAYSGDDVNLPSGASSSLVPKTASTTTVSVSSNPATLGQPVTLTANVTGNNPTGVITFMDGATVLGTVSVNGGTANTLINSFNTAGLHNITVEYGGDIHNTASTSSATALEVTNVSITSLSLSVNPAALGQFVSMTATVTGNNPVGNIRFMDGTTLLATASLSAGTVTASTSFNTPGTHNITAIYDGDTNNAVSTSTPVVLEVTNVPNQSPVVNITAPANNSNFTAPANITLTANATDSDGTIALMQFYKDGLLLGTATQQGTTSTYTFNWNNVAEGSYTITAVAMDNSGDNNSMNTFSTAIQLTVTAGVAQIYYIHTDQLDTPRLITDSSNTKVWEWNNDDPFANNAPNDDPNSTDNHFTYNQRLPGQYYDSETNTHYNYFRDYDPATGRYVESDPIGLEGGINTYAYVEGNPLSYVDPEGLLLTGLHGLTKGITPHGAAQAGGTGTVAAGAGAIGAAGVGIGASGGAYLILPKALRYAVSIASATMKGALLKTPGLPPPRPPLPPLKSPPVVECRVPNPNPALSLPPGLYLP